MASLWNRRIRRYVPAMTIFVLAFILRFGYWAYKGTSPGGDFSGYLAACEVWATNPLGIITAHKGIFYAGFTGPFCAVQALPGATVNMWVAIQITLSAVACLLVYDAGTRLINRRAGIVAGLTLTILWDTFLWTTLLISTATFTFAMALSLWGIAWYRDSPTRRRLVGVFAAFALLATAHPFGPPIIVGWIVWEATDRIDVDLRLFDHRTLPAVVGSLSILLLPYAATRYGILPRLYKGQVIANDPTYRIPVEAGSSLTEFLLTNHILVLAIPAARVGLFFVPFLPRNSIARIVLNLATFTPTLLVACYGTYLAWGDRPDLVRYLVTPAVVMLAITAMLFVSWDLRYRAVLGPPMALLVGYAASQTMFVDLLLERVSAVLPLGRECVSAGTHD